MIFLVKLRHASPTARTISPIRLPMRFPIREVGCLLTLIGLKRRAFLKSYPLFLSQRVPASEGLLTQRLSSAPSPPKRNWETHGKRDRVRTAPFDGLLCLDGVGTRFHRLHV